MSKIDYSNLTEEQLKVIYQYLKDDMRLLKKICFFVWGKHKIPSCYHDDLYDDAMNVLVESVITFNPNDSKFRTYLVGNVRRSYKDWCRDNYYRAKRNNLELDENGKIKKDEKGNPIVIPNISLDTPINTEDGIVTMKEYVGDKKTIEKIFFEEREDIYSEEMQNYLNGLSTLQKEVLRLISIGFTPLEIMEELHIDRRLYEDCYLAIHSQRNIKKLL